MRPGESQKEVAGEVVNVYVWFWWSGDASDAILIGWDYVTGNARKISLQLRLDMGSPLCS